MKKILSVISLILLAGCGNLSSLNERMDKSTEMIQGNTAAIQVSSQAITENTKAVEQSSQNLQAATEVIAGSTAFLQQVMQQLNLHPILFPLLLIFLLLALSLPSIIMYYSYRTLFQKVASLLEQNKKK